MVDFGLATKLATMLPISSTLIFIAVRQSIRTDMASPISLILWGPSELQGAMESVFKEMVAKTVTSSSSVRSWFCDHARLSG
jgi:hypothetical protein